MAKRSKKAKKKPEPQPAVKPKLSLSFIENHPDWAAMGALLILLLIFFSPVMFANKTLLPPDSVASKCYEPFVEDALDRGVYPLWNPYIYGGMPSLASLSRAPFMDATGTIIMGVVWVIQRVLPLPEFTRLLIEYLLLGGLVYLLLRSKKIQSGIAFFAGLVMVFMPPAMAYTAFGHSSKLRSVVFIPLIFLLVERLLKKRNLLFFSLTGLAMGMQLLRAHTQMCFYTQLMVGIYFVYWAVLMIKDKEKIGKIVLGGGLLVGAIVAGVMLSSVLNLSVLEYADHSIRGGGETGGLAYDYATNWSFPPSEILTYLIPSFMGFGRESYWGPMPFTDLPLYFGLTVLMLAGLSLIVKRNRTTWFFTILAGITLFISFGKHLPLLYGPMFKFLPFFNKFRAPNMIQIVFAFAMVILAALGLQGLLDFKADKQGKSQKAVRMYLTWFGGILALLFIFLLAGKGTYMGWAAKASAPEAAYDKAVGDALKALVFFGLTAVFIMLAVRERLSRRLLPLLMAALVFIDFWLVNRRFVEPQPRTQVSAYFAETPDVRFLKSQDGPFRILQAGDQRSPNWYMYHSIQNIGGYQGAKMQSYQDLVNAFGAPDGFLRKYLKMEGGRYAWKSPEEISPTEANLHRAFMRLMNIRYVLSPYPLSSLDPDLTMVHAPANRGSNGVFEFTGALPRAFFPKAVVRVADGESALRAMTDSRFDPLERAYVVGDFPFEAVGSAENRAEVTAYDLHRIDLSVDVKAPSLMVLSELYYPAGWKAFVDDAPTQIYQSDFALRSVFLEPGIHHVRFIFEPRMFSLGRTLTFVTAAFLLAGIAVGLLLEKRKRIQTEKD